MFVKATKVLFTSHSKSECEFDDNPSFVLPRFYTAAEKFAERRELGARTVADSLESREMWESWKTKIK